MSSSKTTATIFIPVRNGEHDHLKSTLDAVFSLSTTIKYEVLITDSESTDNSAKIIESYVKKHSNLKFISIKKADFNHGKTRQWAAEISKSEYMVYLTQDAIPAHKHWLDEMLRPFSLNDQIVAVLGRQIPRSSTPPAQKYETNRVFAGQGSTEGITLHQAAKDRKSGTFDATTFYSDVCSATRRKFLLDTISYRLLQYSEDQKFGQEIIDAGFIKAYTPYGAVIHNNDAKPRSYKKRIFDEIYNMRKNGVPAAKVSFAKVIVNTTKGSLKDFMFMSFDHEYSAGQKFRFFFANPWYQFAKWRGIRLANRAKLGSDHSKNSLEGHHN